MMATVDQLLNDAHQAVVGRRFDAAKASLESLLLRAPSHVRARLLLSTTLLRLDRYRDARAQALEVASQPPADLETELDLFQKLRLFNEHELMRASARRLLSTHSANPLQHMRLVSGLSAIGAFELAGEVAARMRAGAPHHPATLLTAGHLAIHRGDLDEAERELELAIAIAPELPMAHWLLARLRTQGPTANHVARLQRLVADPSLPPADAALIAFALHKELHDLARHEDAWAVLENACALKRSVTRYNEAESMSLFDALESQSSWPTLPTGASSPVPIFIVGMHRSGTTLLEQVLGRHPHVENCGETYRFSAQLRLAADHHCAGVLDAEILRRVAHFDLGAVGNDYLAGCRARLPAAKTHFTEKLPSNFLAIGLIRRALPDAIILHVQRDPLDTCVSNLRELFSDACAYSYDQQELGRYYLRYQRLMRHWHQVFPGQIFDLQYEELVADPENVMRRVVAYCGLHWSDECLATKSGGSVTTASAVQVRSPIHRRSVGGWRNYATQLLPLQRIIGLAAQ